jgi:hypothetical protein
LKILDKVELSKHKSYSIYNEVATIKSLHHPLVAEFFDFLKMIHITLLIWNMFLMILYFITLKRKEN